MDNELIEKKCGAGVKIVLTISLLFNFFIIAIIGVVFFKIAPLLNSFANSSDVNIEQVEPSTNPNGEVIFTPEQESIMRSVGVDPAKVPTSAEEITPELATCLVNAVGEKRAKEIEEGSAPTPLEIIKASNCLK